MNFLYYKSLAIQGFIGVTREGRVYIVIFDSVNASGSAGVVCGGAEDMSVVGTVYVAESSSVKECTAVPFSVYFKETDIDSVKIDVLSTKIMSIIDSVISSGEANVENVQCEALSSNESQEYVAHINIGADTYASIIIDNIQEYFNVVDVGFCYGENIYTSDHINSDYKVSLISYNGVPVSIAGVVCSDGSVLIDSQYGEIIDIVGHIFDRQIIYIVQGEPESIGSPGVVSVFQSVSFKLARPSTLSDFSTDTLNQLSDKTLIEMFVIIS